MAIYWCPVPAVETHVSSEASSPRAREGLGCSTASIRAGGKRGDVRLMPFVIMMIMLQHSGLKSLPRGAH